MSDFHDGYNAFRRDRRLSSNPHCEGSDAWDMWREGWLRGQDDVEPGDQFKIDFVADVRQYLTKFGMFYMGPPRTLPSLVFGGRMHVLHEEFVEYANAHASCDREAQLDALVDMTFATIATAISHGYDFNKAWNRVVPTLLDRVRSPNHPGEVDAALVTPGTAAGKPVIKPEGWQEPNLKDLVR